MRQLRRSPCLTFGQLYDPAAPYCSGQKCVECSGALQRVILEYLASRRHKGALRSGLPKRFAMDASKFQYVAKAEKKIDWHYNLKVQSPSEPPMPVVW